MKREREKLSVCLSIFFDLPIFCLPKIGAHTRNSVLRHLVDLALLEMVQILRLAVRSEDAGQQHDLVRGTSFLLCANARKGQSRCETAGEQLSAVTCGKAWVRASQLSLKERTSPRRKSAGGIRAANPKVHAGSSLVQTA
jgi:hypothetical protein